MQPETVETVRVAAPVTHENPHGFVVINKADLKPDHTLYEPAKPQRARNNPRCSPQPR